MKVVRQENRMFSVVDDNGYIVAAQMTNTEAWRFIDRSTGEVINRSEDVSEWVFKKMADRN